MARCAGGVRRWSVRSAMQILPVYGEGDHEVVEGGVRLSSVLTPPSVSPAAIHLPINGEDFQ
jgi:hypothetical protein